jgi:glycerol kinase
MSRYIGAIDQGYDQLTFIIFDRSGATIGSAQMEHQQIFPQAGWVEHDPMEIWRNTQTVITQALADAGIGVRDLDCRMVAASRDAPEG